MKISDCTYPKIAPVKTYTPTFQGIKLKKLFSIGDFFIKDTSGLKCIRGIKAGATGGTVCLGSIPMKNFFAQFSLKEIENLKKKGMSTNADGFPSCFLKTKSDVPISTSFIHDCSAMYLYNKNTKTHMLYHAAYNTPKKTLDSIMDILMPEGFSTGIIIPGSSNWTERHEDNMHNMFELMKNHNPDSKVNVYHDSSWYPEVVGYKGEVFEIPNKIMYLGGEVDEGQASFRIVDAQSYNTFDKIVYNCNLVKDASVLKKEFEKAGFSKEMLSALFIKIDEKVKCLKVIENCRDFELYEALEEYLSHFGGFKEALKIQCEKLLLNELKSVKTLEELDMFCEKSACYRGFEYMKELRLAIEKKRKSCSAEILSKI